MFDRRSFVSRTSLAHARINPLQNQISDLKAILVLHDHVAIASKPAVRWVQHLSLPASRLKSTDERLTTFVTGLPRG
jgi:hypothetical protein